MFALSKLRYRQVLSKGDYRVSEEAEAYEATDPAELWRRWNETTAKLRASIPDGEGEVYGSLFDLYRWWIKSGIACGLWYNATYRAWVQLAGAMMCHRWLISSWNDMARIVKHLAGLEERVNMIDGVFVNLTSDGGAATLDQQVVEGKGVHQESPEGQLQTVDRLISISPRTTVEEELAGRLDRVENKLDKLLDILMRIETGTDTEAAWPKREGKGE
jgi:hypothetical protein